MRRLKKRKKKTIENCITMSRVKSENSQSISRCSDKGLGFNV